MVCGSNPACHSFLMAHRSSIKNSVYISKWLRRGKPRTISPDICKWHEIQVSVSVIKFYRNTAMFIHSLRRAWVVEAALVALYRYSARRTPWWCSCDLAVCGMPCVFPYCNILFFIITRVMSEQKKKSDFACCSVRVLWYVNYSVIKLRWQSPVFLVQGHRSRARRKQYTPSLLTSAAAHIPNSQGKQCS